MSVAIEGKKSRLVAADYLLQFVECSVHLFLRNLGWAEPFSLHQRFGHTVMLTGGTVRNTVKQFCLSIRNLVLMDRVHSVVVVSNANRANRLIIELPVDFCRTVFYMLPSHAHRSDLEIAATCAKVLGDTFEHIQRHLAVDTSASISSFELFVVVKRNCVPGTELSTPTGFEVLSLDALKSPRWLRLPLKSAVLEDTVVISVYTDSIVW